MDETLQALYDGEIAPAEQYRRPQSKEYAILREQNHQHYEEFIKKLDQPLRQEFDRFLDEQISTLSLEFSQVFIDGFRLGAKMIIEVYEEGERRR